MLMIADDFFETLDIGWVDIDDIILTGKRQGNTWDIPPANVIEGQNYIGHNRIILDFEFVTIIQEVYFTHPDGNPTTSKDEGWHPGTPKIVYWSCEIHS